MGWAGWASGWSGNGAAKGVGRCDAEDEGRSRQPGTGALIVPWSPGNEVCVGEAKRAESKAQRLWRLLSGRPGKWWTNMDLVRAGCGFRFGHSVHLLRQGKVTGKPEAIETKALDRASGVFCYRLKPEAKP